MESLKKARARWNLLRDIHPLFAESLPTTFSARNAPVHGDALERLNNEITKLRSEITMNILRQDQHGDDLESLLSTSGVEELAQSAGNLLNGFEALIDDEILGNGGIRLDEAKMGLPAVKDATDLSSFPKQCVLRDLLRGLETETRFVATVSTAATLDRKTALEDESPVCRSMKPFEGGLSYYIGFPKTQDTITSFRRVVQQFGATIMRLFADKIGRRHIEARTQRFTRDDIKTLQNASAFASTYADLFKLMTIGACPKGHQARVYLCSLTSEQLKMTIATCQEHRWIHATFKRSVDDIPEALFSPIEACDPATVSGKQFHSRFIAFNDDVMWEQHNAADSEPEVSTCIDPNGLQPLLGSAAPYSRHFTPKNRKLLGYLLAYTLLQLYGSPWISTHLCQDAVCLQPHTESKSRFVEWMPHMHCALTPVPNILDASEYIAAFGVLVMELEANDSAEWTEDDIDWETGTRSNQVRLGRILKEWEETVRDDYRLVGKACHDFKSLVETFEHCDVDSHLSDLAIIYKCILEPLFQILKQDFGSDTQLFQGIPCLRRGLAGSPDQSHTSHVKWELFDDFDTEQSDLKVTRATKFMKDLEPFVDEIKSSRGRPPALTSWSFEDVERIRVAILDSGVDETDSKISSALYSRRIRDRRSWVEKPLNHQDTYGHGTHVTRLLLDIAPEAEIYIAKICNEKFIKDEFMPGIAEAIDWAIDKWNAHIISLSFGFRDDYEPIDAAIDRAVKKGRLIFAAASNGGGIKSRTRPATNRNVICIHACDGLGNKGEMNPTPLDNVHNFTTLGVGIRSRWRNAEKREDVWKSGTSFATPIAAAFAADILEFANFHCDLSDQKRLLLQECRGMEAIFEKMSESRDRYEFVYPRRLWEGRTTEEVARYIERIIQSV